VCAAQRAFTLIELLVVMIIISILIAIIVPVLGSVRTAARKAGTQALMTNIMQAAQKFQNDERRLPGLFDPASMGGQENDQPDVGMSAAENALADMAGVDKIPANSANPATGTWITVGPFAGAGDAKNYKINIELLGAGNGTKNYFTPDDKHLAAQDAGISQIGGLGNAAAAGVAQLPDIVDDFGQPILFWVRDDTYLGRPGANTFKFASKYAGPAGSTGFPGSTAQYYWASNACFLKSASLGRKGRDQTDATNGSMIGPGVANQADLEKSLTAFLGNPAYPYRPANQVGFPTVPSSGRAALILQSAGADGVYFGMKDRGARQFPLAGTTPVGEYRYSFTTDGTNPQTDKNGQPTTHDLTSEFDDLTNSGGD
jgi:prepilin-type N-terminal cleavage/methylation domain-containing protein